MTRLVSSNSVVRVTDAEGRLIALIDPVTRIRRGVRGGKATTLSPQGFALSGRNTPSWPGHAKAHANRRKNV